MSTDRSSTGKSGIGRNGAGRRPGIRRSLEALGLAAAIALGGITVISPEEAHAAGITPRGVLWAGRLTPSTGPRGSSPC